jgi:hypothetical protein
MKPLASNRSARWAFMEKFVVPQYDGDGNYLTRWRVVQTPWFGLYLHRMDGPDPRPTLHDHPWHFLSIVLRGGYVERRLDPLTMEVDEGHVVRRVNHVHAKDAHSIRRLLRTPTWTLLLVGKRVRTWGYIEPEDGWWRWTEFDMHRHADEFSAAMARRREAEVVG